MSTSSRAIRRPICTREGSAIVLKAAADGEPFTGGGYTLTGNQDQISLTAPDGAKLDCHH